MCFRSFAITPSLSLAVFALTSSALVAHAQTAASTASQAPSAAPTAPSTAPSAAPVAPGAATSAPGGAPVAPEPAPAPPSVAPANPVPAPSPAPVPTLAVPPVDAARTTVPAPPANVDLALVHLASNYPNTWLELKSTVDDSGWQRSCAAPCDREIPVRDMLARAVAPNMSPSNAFRIDPGPGAARVRVEGGSSTHRTLGVGGLVAGIPITFAGMAMFGYGKLEDKDTLTTAGAVVLGTGAAVVLIALPLLFSGRTAVKDGKGTTIAKALAAPAF